MKQTFLISAVATALLTGCSAEQKAIPETSIRHVDVVELQDPNALQLRHYTGVLRASETANLAFRVPGTVQDILVKTGQKVSQGDVLARLDPHDYEVVVLELEARLAEAKASLRLANAELKRVRQARNDNAIASVNLDRAISAQQRAAAGVKVVEQNLKKAQDALAYTELTAPFDGVIGRRFLEQHEQAGPAIWVFTVHQPTGLEAVVDVPESQIAQFELGQSATVSWYQAEQEMSATLKEISTLPDPIKQTYTAKFVLSDASNELLPGKAINLALATKPTSQGYCLPYSALKTEAEQLAVWRVEAQVPELVKVKVESQNRHTVCVSGDLTPGDLIVSSGANFMKVGQQVKLNNPTMSGGE
ncbi:efflux RND transporter periplasmic adaptor subunit [Motilimonas eburnea]|uniref:efflux RND transporter periplasmic adaptor subunit n=1 Tax=Motilimonas eburnea TaxID=1737488 RepID=UPI001E4A4BC0|nr:efflux RND transporter periplasmic adaptor subunit [Motilimonas eburnea]MCE2573459.1 efflux RND transporter periplasmic adaptor subunit [Motilimonas eburnea]